MAELQHASSHRVVGLTAVAWGGLEMALRARLMFRPGLPGRLRDWREQAGRRLREWTFGMLVVTLAAAVMLAGWASRLRWAAIGGGWATVIAGEITAVAGIALRIWAILTLDRLFTFAVGIADGHRLVRHGPYRLIRHPGYAGALIAMAGIGLALANWISVLILALVPAVVIAVRIRVEEAVLRGALGEEYLDYAGRTARLIPRIW